MDALKATYLEASEEVARIDARIRDKLLKRARKQGMTSQDELIKLVEL
jgi:cell division protein FtsL